MTRGHVDVEEKTAGHTRRVIVMNHYAIPREVGGVTRQIDLFGRLKNWRPKILASSFGHTQGTRISTSDSRFRLLWVPSYSTNGTVRILGWGVFSVEAFIAGLGLKADAVFASSPHLLTALSGLALAKVRGLPFILEVRDLWPESIVTAGEMNEGSLIHKALVTLEGMLYRHADRIVVVTKGWEEHFASFGVDPSKVVVVPNGTELSDFDVAQSREELRREYRIEGYTAVFAGAHGPYVGLPLILDAAEQLPDINFLLIGSGSQKDAAIADARRRGLNNVEFRDPIPKSELPRLLKACDVGIHSISPQSVFDKGMSPNKLFDYLAAGLPTVTNARVPLRDVVSDDEVGSVVDPQNLVDGLRRVRAADPDTLSRWRRFAVEMMSTRYSRASASDRLEQTLDSVVK